MKLIFIILGVVCFMVAVKGRHVHDVDSEEEQNAEDSLQDRKEQLLSRLRHRRRSRQPYFDYNYPPYYDNRRENSRQDDLYSDILKLLDELSTLIKHPPPPPPPQPIYIPYPVPYPVPQYLPCSFTTNNSTGSNNPNFTIRWPEMEDELQNWGLIPGDVGDNDDDSDDGVRPISFVPIVPKGIVKEAPPVEHGSVQAGMETTTRPSVNKPGVCQVAILTCCNLKSRSERQSCFQKYDCIKTFSTGLSCRPEVVRRVLQEFVKIYAPANEA